MFMCRCLCGVVGVLLHEGELSFSLISLERRLRTRTRTLTVVFRGVRRKSLILEANLRDIPVDTRLKLNLVPPVTRQERVPLDINRQKPSLDKSP